MKYVFVLDTHKQPLDPIHPAEARKLLRGGQAAIFRTYPFTIILKFGGTQAPEPLRVKVDPGSKTTGLAVVHNATGRVVWGANLNHRGQRIKDALAGRRAIRRSRRNRKTRYRQRRFLNRKRPQGWLAPSLQSRVDNIVTWVKRLGMVSNVTDISMELVRFDMQQMDHPEISGVEYQQGELAGYEVREYVLEKFNRRCAYCKVENVPMQIEHIVPRARGGSNRVSNLTLACEPCNQKKGARTAEEFGYPEVQRQAKRPLKDAAAVNSTRWKLYQALQASGMPIEVGSGGRTKFNRRRLGLPKDHWIDAACGGVSTPAWLHVGKIKPLVITATGHGSRQMCRMDRYGFPRTSAKGAKKVFGFQTGDMVRAVVTSGSKVGTYVGKVAVRTTGSFNIKTEKDTIQGIGYKYCRIIHHADGYTYR